MKSTTNPVKQSARRLSLLFKAISLLLIAVIVTGIFSGCEDTVIATEAGTGVNKNNHSYTTAGASISIGYSDGDSLNPYFTETDLNSDLASLIFEPLFYIDDSFSARPSLASSYEIKESTLLVTLDTRAAFSDGVQFSSADVIYSFSLAKASGNYSDELSYITSATAVGADKVSFTLSEINRNAAASLSFPVVKSQTASDASAMPLGTGLYKIVQSGENIRLDYNPYCRKPHPEITTVKLQRIPEASTLIHTLELGTIDAFFDDMSSGSYSQANAQTSKTNLSNLVFLGINSNSYGLSSPALRQAVYYSVNRNAVVKKAFRNYATESAVPYHPEWHEIAASGYDISALNLDYSKAQSLMQNAGFREALNYSLIVYSGNNFKVAAAKEIKESLANVNIHVNIRELTWQDYKEALSAGNYDFYIGEIRLPSNMNMSALFGAGGAIKGTSVNDTTAAAYSEFANGNISLEAFTASFLQNMPFVPVCFRMGALICKSTITPTPDCDDNNAYKNIYEWKIQ